MVVLAVALGCGRCDRGPLPPVPAGLEFADERGQVVDPKAAYTLIEDSARLEVLFQAAAQREPRSMRVWQGLEALVHDRAVYLAEQATEPLCLKLPDVCLPDWNGEEALGRNAAGVRLREVLAETFGQRALARGMDPSVLHHSLERLRERSSPVRDGGAR